MNLYIKHIQKAKYQLTNSRKLILSMSQQILTFYLNQYLNLQLNIIYVWIKENIVRFERK